MAATTPNLGLTLPVGNEKVSRQIINGNNSIIDTAFGSAGAKLLDIELNEVTNVSGAYTGTTYDDRVTSAMKALEIEMGNPGAFRANITVNCGAGYITLSCSDVVGTSTVKVSVLKLVQDPTQVTSTEFDILNNRIGTLDNLDTTNKTSAVAAINEVKGDIPPVINNLTSDSTTSALSAAQGKALNDNIALQQKFQIGDTFNFDAAQFSFRTLGNLSGIYFRYRLPKPVADNVTSFTVTITVQSPCWSNCGVATIPVNATVSNIGILDKRTISFSVVPSETIANSGFGVSELNADITFT